MPKVLSKIETLGPVISIMIMTMLMMMIMMMIIIIITTTTTTTLNMKKIPLYKSVLKFLIMSTLPISN